MLPSGTASISASAVLARMRLFRGLCIGILPKVWFHTGSRQDAVRARERGERGERQKLLNARKDTAPIPIRSTAREPTSMPTQSTRLVHNAPHPIDRPCQSIPGKGSQFISRAGRVIGSKGSGAPKGECNGSCLRSARKRRIIQDVEGAAITAWVGINLLRRVNPPYMLARSNRAQATAACSATTFAAGSELRSSRSVRQNAEPPLRRNEGSGVVTTS